MPPEVVVPAVAYLGGSALMASGGGGGSKGLAPEVEASLRQQGVDVNRLVAESDAYARAYGISQNEALQRVYNEKYAPVEANAAQFAQDVYGGGGPVLGSALSNLARQTGQSESQALNQAKTRLLQAGIDPNSPAGQAELGRVAREVRNAASSQASALYAQLIPQATQVMTRLQESSRLAGGPTPTLDTQDAQNFLRTSQSRLNFLQMKARGGDLSSQELQELYGLRRKIAQAQETVKSNPYGMPQTRVQNTTEAVSPQFYQNSPGEARGPTRVGGTPALESSYGGSRYGAGTPGSGQYVTAGTNPYKKGTIPYIGWENTHKKGTVA